MNKRRDNGRLIIMITAITLLLVAFVFLLLIDTPVQSPPKIVLKDMEDSDILDENYELQFFDQTIYPGASGEYSFRVENPYTQRLSYSFEIVALYRGEPVEDFPMLYRVRLNNGLLNTEEWLDVEDLDFSELVFLPESEHLITLEWDWPFESGDDQKDTQYGIDNGDYALVFHITAELVEEETN